MFSFQVGENSTSALTQCLCTHLTTFGSGFKIPINKIDLSDSAFLKLHENPVVFIFMVCCLCLYFLVIIWARKADKRDILKVWQIPLNRCYLCMHNNSANQKSSFIFIFIYLLSTIGKPISETLFSEVPSNYKH